MPDKDNSRMLRAGVLVVGELILDRSHPRGGARFTWDYPAKTGSTIHRFSLFAFFWTLHLHSVVARPLAPILGHLFTNSHTIPAGLTITSGCNACLRGPVTLWPLRNSALSPVTSALPVPQRSTPCSLINAVHSTKHDSWLTDLIPRAELTGEATLASSVETQQLHCS